MHASGLESSPCTASETPDPQCSRDPTSNSAKSRPASRRVVEDDPQREAPPPLSRLTPCRIVTR